VTSRARAGDDNCIEQLDPTAYQSADDFASGFVEGAGDVLGRFAHPIDLAFDTAYVAINPLEAADDITSNTVGAISAAVQSGDARAMGRVTGSISTQALLAMAIEAGIGAAAMGTAGRAAGTAAEVGERRDPCNATGSGIAVWPQYQIPGTFVENPYRAGSYGEVVNGKFVERLRIDPPTPPGTKGPSYSHYHLDGKSTHYSPRPGDPDPGFPQP
jgi:hypothetical protein